MKTLRSDRNLKLFTAREISDQRIKGCPEKRQPLYFCPMYRLLIIKRKIESTVMFPFVLAGRLWASLNKKDEYAIYFFFPFHHIGGAEKVHYQIAQTFTGKKAIIYFTRKSKKENFLAEFQKAGFTIKDISRFTDNKWIYPFNFIFRGIVSQKINQQAEAPLVFNGQSNFGYKVSPWIASHVPQVDLIHALCSFSLIRIPFLEFYAKSVTVSREIIEKHEVLYQQYRLPAPIVNNIQYINYGIELPAKTDKIADLAYLNVLYVGRGSPEKRIHLIAGVAKELADLDTSVRFHFLGDVSSFIPKELWTHCIFLGSITNELEVDKIYRQNDVLLVTSETESGPLVAMEAMARGLAIIATPVGIINEHVLNKTNGFVFSSITNEDKIVQEAVEYIMQLKANPKLRQTIANNNMDYAYEHFRMQKFRQHYKKLFQSVRQSL